jgi:hypothetical protein
MHEIAGLLHRLAIDFLRRRAIGRLAGTKRKRDQRSKRRYTDSYATPAAGTEMATPTRH